MPSPSVFTEQTPLYKRWYVWIILLLGIFALFSTGVILILLSQKVSIVRNPATPIITLNTPIPTFNPSVRISPKQGNAGTEIVVSGEGWTPHATINLYLEDTSFAKRVPKNLATTTVSDEGRFDAVVTYPADEAWTNLTGILITAQSSAGKKVSTAFLLLSPTQTPFAALETTPVPVANTNAAEITTITVDTLIMRTGPAIAYPPMKILGRADNPTVMGQDETGDWLLVRLPDGTDGWILRLFTTFQNLTAVVPAPTLPVEPTPVVITEWQGEYWANPYFEGEPALVRNDTALEFNWGEGSPNTTIPVDDFSARWIRNVEFEPGDYLFHLTVDDGAKLWVDNQLLIDDWHDGPPRKTSTSLALAGGVHNLRVEYYERNGGARVRMWWEQIPSSDYPDWTAEYWANKDLSSEPTLTRNDSVIDFDWEGQSPADGLPSDEFSVRWGRWVNFEPGTYRFRARADDGLRFYLNGNMVLDKWTFGNWDDIHAVDLNLSGPHWLTVEYNEQTGPARVRFWWERLNTQPLATPAPPDQAIATPTPHLRAK